MIIMLGIKNKLQELRQKAISDLEGVKESEIGQKCFEDVETGLKVMTNQFMLEPDSLDLK